MPQELTCVYEMETGEPTYMHSVDAAEAVRLGDYTFDVPTGKGSNEDPDAHGRARAKAMGGMSPAHAELQSPDERERRRTAANTVMAPVITIPTGTPVVLKEGDVPRAPAPSEPQATRHAHSESTRGAHAESSSASKK